MLEIPIIKPEEVTETELSELSEEIKKVEKERRKRIKEYKFTKDDIAELNKRMVEGEDLDEIEKDISERAILAEPKKVKPIFVKPIEIIPPPPIPPSVAPTLAPTPPSTLPPIFPDYLLERERKKAKRAEKRIIKSELKGINYPPGECCSNVCNILNNDIENYIGIISPNQDQKLMFDTLVELRRQFYINGSCQCADGILAERTGIPLREKQIEDCCPSVCETLDNTIDEYEGILLPTHRIRIIKDALYDIRKKFFDNNACKCVATEEQLKPRGGGAAIDPILLNKLAQLAKFAEKQNWIK